MIKLSLPGFFDNYPTLLKFLNYYNQHPDQFYDDRCIDSFYGADESLIWRGGRNVITMYKYDTENLLSTLQNFPNIKIRYTFTNSLITKELAKDYLCNNFVSRFIRPQDEVILNSPALIEHFKQHYPNIPIIYSTTLDIKDIDAVNKITETNLYVLNYNYNNDEEYLNKLKYPHNIEIICAEPCLENCPRRTAHYFTISKQILCQPTLENDTDGCPFMPNPITFYEIMQRKHAITNERIKELEKQGFEYFKLSGRGIFPTQLIEVLLYYLAQPKYINHIREVLLMEMYV